MGTLRPIVILVDRAPPDLLRYPSMERHREPITPELGDLDLVTTAASGRT